jgi:GntR family transcriptional regulator/MocR family aminotransferase
MARTAPATMLPSLSLDPRRSGPLSRQLEERLRHAILAGELAAGERLPSSRAMAARLGVSRTTVLAAFDRLLAEGYLVGQAGSGTYVAASSQRAEARPQAPPQLSRRGARIARTSVAMPHGGGPAVPFRSGVPALDRFPADVWASLGAARLRDLRQAAAGYPDPAGHPPLRAAVADYLAAHRGVRCTPEQVLIVTGSQQAIDLAARVLLDPGDPVWVEDPGYLGARGALAAAGARLHPRPLDREGMTLGDGPARMVYVTPSHQYPLGVTMSLPRRLALLDWAERRGAFIFEDDYDSEYRYAGKPLTALQGLDESGRVIYAGTFSKVLFPALRIGYLVVPRALQRAFTAAIAIAGRGTPVQSQAVLADFMAAGHFARHIRRTRLLYAERQAALVAAARRHLAGLLEVGPAQAGMHLVGWLPEGTEDALAAARALARGVEAVPLSSLSLLRPPRGGLLLGYTGYDGSALEAGAARLAEALAEGG